MVKSRGAAVIGAFVLIVVAIFVRGLIVGDDGGSGSDGSGKEPAGGLPVVACSPEVIEVCDALASAGKIADRPPELDIEDAAAPPDDVDGWITWNPAPQIANYVSSPSGATRVWGDPSVLGSATTGVLIDGITADELSRTCLKDATWSCLSQRSSELGMGVGDPATAEGLARLAPLASALAEGNDPETLDEATLQAIVASPADGQVDAGTGAVKLATQPGYLSLVVGPASLLERQTKTEAGKARGLDVIAVEPAATLTLVMAPRAGREDDLDDLTCKGLPARAEEAVAAAGLTACTGSADAGLAGFLYQVRNKVG